MRAELDMRVLGALLALIALCACGEDASPERQGNPANAGAGGTQPAAGGAGAHADAATPAGHDSDLDAGRERDAGGTDAAVGDAAVSDAGRSGTVLPDQGPASCHNRLRDGHETDIDCGGADCGVCLSGRHCEADRDCLSGECADNACTCVPLTTCPANACGQIRHCGGELDCGECASGVCYENQCCTPRACEDGECGVFADGCGGTVRCGDEDCCTPRTCEHPSLENRCGDFDDRCGGSVTCSCGDPDARCYLGECCMPLGCDEIEACGVAVSDGCGGVVNCGCDRGATCYHGECCTPLDCSSWVGPGCGLLDDGCGGSVSCGCAPGQTCNGGTCCNASACPAGNAGDACGALSDGCGGTQNCGCAALPCYGGTCCVAQSCDEQGLQDRCGPATDGCGTANLWCGCGMNAAIRVEQRNACGQSCGATLDAVRACETGAALEVLEQTAGWNFSSSFSSNLCNASYGFSPNWTSCHTGFQLDAQGFIYLGAGTHCFSVTAGGLNTCGALYFVSDPATFPGWDALPGSTAATVVSGNAAVCFTLASADYYPIRWHYSQSNAFSSFTVNYCPDSAANCAPLPSSMLRPALP
jgi:hypothetical protein